MRRHCLALSDSVSEGHPRTAHKITTHLGAWVTELILEIPAGTPCIPADNLEKGGFWLDPDPADIPNDPGLESWFRNIGVWIAPEEVTS